MGYKNRVNYQPSTDKTQTQTCGSTIGIADLARRAGDLTVVLFAVC